MIVGVVLGALRDLVELALLPDILQAMQAFTLAARLWGWAACLSDGGGGRCSE